MTKFDFEILVHFYVLRSREFIYAIFTVMYVFMNVRVYVSGHAHFWYAYDQRWKNPNALGECRMHNFLQRYKRSSI